MKLHTHIRPDAKQHENTYGDELSLLGAGTGTESIELLEPLP